MQHELQVEILKTLMEQLDQGRNIDAGVQYKMPTSAYVCPEVAAAEKASFFQDHPQLVGLSNDLPGPGTYFTMDDFGTPLLATRDKQGHFHAFLNACRHRSVKVATQEKGKKSIFMCPFHHWSYANTGDLINVPDEHDFGELDKSCHGLIELPAVEQDGLLWVHPNPEGTLDLETLLGRPLREELATFSMQNHQFAGEKIIDMKLNWKLANDTFGETYHFGKLHQNTLGKLYYGNNLHLEEFGRHHRFVTANRGLDALRELPESQWNITHATFVMYYLFPNVQLIVNPQNLTLIRMYPDFENPGRSITKVGFYYTAEVAELARQSKHQTVNSENVYDYDARIAGLEASLEVFRSTVEHEDYLMGEMQQKAAENGTLKEVIFGRNEPALHHFHTSFREALGQAPLEPVS
ncbi:MAG: aromatic ring-hydroxylating dioxygenase subunit alpha [Pseudomonadota bacterium]